MKKIRILQGAAEEAIAAANWYDEQRKGLGTEFTNAVETAIDQIEEGQIPLSPILDKVGEQTIKRLMLKRFPFSIIVLENRAETVVIAIAHHSRKPGYWKKR